MYKKDKATLTHQRVVYIYIVYEINLRPFKLSVDPSLVNSLSGTVKLVKNAEIDKHKYSGYGSRCETKGIFSLSNGSEFGKSLLTFTADMCSSVHVGNKKKYILNLGNGPTVGLDDTTLTPEKEYLINFTKQHRKLCLCLHCNGADGYVFINVVEIHKFEEKDSEINASLSCLGNVSKDFSVDNMKKQDYMGMSMVLVLICGAIAVDDTSDIHKYFMKKNGM